MIEEEIDMQIGSTYKEDVKESPRTDDERSPGNTGKDDAAYVRELNTIMTGNLVDAEAALKRRIDTKNKSEKYDDDKIVSFEITDDQIILRRQKGDPLTIDRTGDSGLEDDLETDIDESISTLSTLDDIVSISDVLSPKNLSKGSIEEIIEREKIILGKRRKGGVGSKVGKSEIPAIGNNAKAPNGLTILESIDAGGIGSKGTVSGTDSNEKIQGVIEGIISEHMPAELAKEISSNPGLYGPTTIEQVPNMDQMKVTIAGKSIVFNTKRLTSLAGIANKITEVMNEARTVVNKNRTNTKLKKSNKNLSFPEWKKVPGNENKKSTDWKKATGRN